MQIRCPNCNKTIESMDPGSREGVRCHTCGQVFSLIADETQITKTRAGQMVGHFLLLEVVGQGAFGVVWRARDIELDRIVAIKTPRHGTLDTEETREFLHEAQAAAQLKHANIVSVHEVGRVDDFLYIVSDFIDGVTLSEWLTENRPTSREAAEMCFIIADALEHAHQAGVIHRDMKPGNILLDVAGSPNIADFGLAKRQVGDMTMTLDGHIVGTPSYMSPEQATGDFFDGRSDIYSTGVILFQLLTGEKPFRGNHRMLLNQVINEEAPSPRKLNGSIPRDLETICLKCLEKKPGRRYSTSRELADDLRRFLAGEPIRARPVHALERVWKWAARRPLVATLLTAFTLAVVMGVTGVTWQWQRVLASQRRHVQTQLKLIQLAEPAGMESAIDGLSDFRELADPELRLLAANTDLPATARFRAQLALVEREPERAEHVVNELLRVTPPDVLDIDELATGTNVLAKGNAIPISRLTDLATDPNQQDAARFRALFILARTAESAQVDDGVPWEKLSSFTVRQLVALATTSPGSYRALVGAFRPVRSVLLPAFRKLLVSDALNRNEGHTAASILGEYAADQPQYLCDLIPELPPEQHAVILPHLQSHRKIASAIFSSILAEQSDAAADQTQKHKLVSRKAIAAVTLLHLDDEPVGVWPLFRLSPDTNLRTELIHRCAELNLPPEKLMNRLGTESDVSARRAILLTLGEYHDLNIALCNELRPRLEELYRSDPDAGIHSTVAWLLRSWDEIALLRSMDSEPLFAGPVTDRQWYVNSQGATMVVIDHPPTFLMGAAENEPLRTKFDRQHLRKVDRRFAIATTEVTWGQFKKFVDDYAATNHSHPVDYGPDLDGPALAVTWVQAAKYCRWLSELEKIPDDQMCFPELDDIHVDMPLSDDLMNRTGYRMPTEGEWECACRAGTVTRRFFGDSDEFLDEYCWHIGNSMDYAWSAGQLKPNDYGLFDIYGNAWEWCLDRHGSLPTRPPGITFIDVPKLVGTKPRVLRGGSMNTRAEAIRSAQRDFIDPLHNRNHNVGLRVVRTLSRIDREGLIERHPSVD